MGTPFDTGRHHVLDSTTEANHDASTPDGQLTTWDVGSH